MNKPQQFLANKEKIYKFIVSFFKKKGKPPTLKEIALFMGFTRRQQCSYYLTKLKKEGKIASVERVKRSIKIL